MAVILKSIRGKILVGYVSIAFFVLVVGIFGIYSLGRQADGTEKLKQSFQVERLLRTAVITNEQLVANEQRYISSGDSAVFDLCQDSEQELRTALANLGRALTDPETINIYKKIQTQSENLFQTLTAINDLNEAGNQEEADALLSTTILPLRDKVTTLFEDLSKTIIHNGEEQDADVTTLVSRLKLGMMAMIAIGVLLALAFGTGISAVITNPIRKAAIVASSYADGDLTVEVDESSGRDEIFAMTVAFRTMGASLRDLVKRITVAAETLASSSHQLAASAKEAGDVTTQVSETIEQIASGNQKAVGAVSETSEAVTNMDGSVDDAQLVLEGVIDEAKVNVDIAGRGTKAVKDVVGNMEQLRDIVVQASSNISELARKSEEIEAVLDLISDIANQTNLLSLNAAIEAARAGEHGRGFAVVSQEVRNLAVKSGKSTKQIADLIAGIRRDIQSTVKSIETGVSAVGEGVRLAEVAGDSLSEISESAESMQTALKEVLNAVGNVHSLSSQVSMAMQTLAAITEETSASSEEVTASAAVQNSSIDEISESAKNLSAMATTLANTVKGFKV